MKKVLIENGRVIDVARVDPESIFSPQYAARFVPAPDDVEPGWLYDGETFTAPPPEVPAEVSAFQAYAALELAGLFATVDAAMDDPGIDPIARHAWRKAQVFRRKSPTIAALSAVLGMTDAELDQLFIAAAGIDA